MEGRILIASLISGLLTQVNPETLGTDILIRLVPHLGVLSILVWYLHHNVKYTVPDINKEHNETIRQINADHNESNRVRNAEHRATIEKLTDKFDSHIQDLTAKFDAQLREERLMRQQEIKDLAGAIRELAKK